MKPLIPVAVAVLAAATLAATAGAAPAPNRAQALSLKKAHFPAGVVARNAAGEASAEGSGYSVTYHFQSGGRPYELSVAVLVFKQRAMARTMFKELRSDVQTGAPKLVLEPPEYGDEQAASHSVLGGSRLMVRTGSVIWMLEPQTYMVRRGKTYELTKKQTVALYKRYGRLQQKLVGKG